MDLILKRSGHALGKKGSIIWLTRGILCTKAQRGTLHMEGDHSLEWNMLGNKKTSDPIDMSLGRHSS